MFCSYKRGLERGLAIREAEIEDLRAQLAAARKREIEAIERADLAADRLLSVYGARGISAAFAREEQVAIERRREERALLEAEAEEPAFGSPGTAYRAPEDALVGPVERPLTGEDSA